MPKLKNDAIGGSDFDEFLESYSDFSFEVSVLRLLRDKGIDCEHGGLYEDQVTGKSREFDIRAAIAIANYRVKLAIECKNIRDNFPVLISCLPRHEDESYHQIAVVKEPSSSAGLYPIGLVVPRAKTVTIRRDHSIYKPKEFVGKNTDQVGRALDGSIVAHDNELFDKWSQCLSSLNDLATRAYWEEADDKITTLMSLLIPIVVM